jgi:hypothetical protein
LVKVDASKTSSKIWSFCPTLLVAITVSVVNALRESRMLMVPMADDLRPEKARLSGDLPAATLMLIFPKMEENLSVRTGRAESAVVVKMDTCWA